MKEETIEVGGHEYKREAWKDEPVLTDHFCAGLGVDPGVLCGQCRNDAFRLVYGDYELFAICSSCGHRDSVYSG